MGAFGTCATSINTVVSHTPHHPRSSSSDSAMTHAVPAICGAALRHATAYFLMHRYSTSLLYSMVSSSYVSNNQKRSTLRLNIYTTLCLFHFGP
jgi:hypothetical protein